MLLWSQPTHVQLSSLWDLDDAVYKDKKENRMEERSKAGKGTWEGQAGLKLVPTERLETSQQDADC